MELLEECLDYLSESWNQFAKLLGVRLVGMQSKVDPYQDDRTERGSKEGSKDGVFPSLSWRLPNLKDEIYLKGVEL